MPATRSAWSLVGVMALAAAAPHPAASPSPAPVYLAVPTGVRLEVKLDERISSQDSATGQHFTFETTQEFTVGDVVIPRGTHGIGTIELSEPRSGKDHGGRLSVSVRSLDLPGGRSIPVSLPQPETGPHIGEERGLGGAPVFGAIVVLDADASGNVVLNKGETFAVITTSTGTPQPIPHSEST